MSTITSCISTRDTHITRDMCMGIHISRGYTYHCDSGTKEFKGAEDGEGSENVSIKKPLRRFKVCRDYFSFLKMSNVLGKFR